MATPDTGYDERGDEEEEPIISFELQKVPHLYAPKGVVCRLMRAGQPIGLFYLKTNLEFDWLKKRLDGDFDSEIYQVKIGGEGT